MKRTIVHTGINDERNKAISRCMNLEGKKEQVSLLIKQLQNLAAHRETNKLSFLQKDFAGQLDYLKPANSIITRELNKALKDEEQLSRDIKDLKSRIESLNKQVKL